MKFIFFSILLLFTQTILSQSKYIYCKVEFNKNMKHSVCTIYLSGGRYVRVQTIQIPTNFLAFECDSAQIVVITLDCNSPSISKSLPVNFSCGDSVVVNATDGSYKVINKRN
jgi:hypothetical protein